MPIHSFSENGSVKMSISHKNDQKVIIFWTLVPTMTLAITDYFRFWRIDNVCQHSVCISTPRSQNKQIARGGSHLAPRLRIWWSNFALYFFACREFRIRWRRRNRSNHWIMCYVGMSNIMGARISGPLKSYFWGIALIDFHFTISFPIHYWVSPWVGLYCVSGGILDILSEHFNQTFCNRALNKLTWL